MRETDFAINTRPTAGWPSAPCCRSSGELWDFKPAADGQMGSVLKLYREWQLSGDTEWLRALWPQAKRAIEWPGARLLGRRPGRGDGGGAAQHLRHRVLRPQHHVRHALPGRPAAGGDGRAPGRHRRRARYARCTRPARPATTPSSGTGSTSTSGWRCRRPRRGERQRGVAPPARSAGRGAAALPVRAGLPVRTSCWGSGSRT